jgi:hypothetical protein
LIGFCWGGLREMSQGTRVQPESSAFGTLVNFIIEKFAETVPIEQCVDASGAGVMDISENVDSVRSFHVEQFGSGACIPVIQFFDFVPLEPEATAIAFTGMRLDTRHLQEFQFVVARRTFHRTIILWNSNPCDCGFDLRRFSVKKRIPL